MNHKPDQTYKAKAFDFTEVPDGYVIYNENENRVVYLNRTATAVLSLCEEESNPASIAAAMQEAFLLKEPPLKDVETCLRLLVEEGLVEPCHTSEEKGVFWFLWRRLTHRV
jgi:hypothetical protein